MRSQYLAAVTQAQPAEWEGRRPLWGGTRGAASGAFPLHCGGFLREEAGTLVTAGALCPEFTVTGRMTQHPDSRAAGAESGLELPPSSQNWPGN